MVKKLPPNNLKIYKNKTKIRQKNDDSIRDFELILILIIPELKKNSSGVIKKFI
jgi:hypothetical protein